MLDFRPESGTYPSNILPLTNFGPATEPLNTSFLFSSCGRSPTKTIDWLLALLVIGLLQQRNLITSRWRVATASCFATIVRRTISLWNRRRFGGYNRRRTNRWTRAGSGCFPFARLEGWIS